MAVPVASGLAAELGGEWADAFADAPPAKQAAPAVVAEAPSNAKDAAARPAQSSSLSELVLDAEFAEDAEVSLSPESFNSAPVAAPVAAAAETAPEPAAVLPGDDLSNDDILEDVDAVSAAPPKAAAAEATDVLEDVDVMSAEPHEAAKASEATDVLEDVDVMSAEPHEAAKASEATDVLEDVDVMSAEPHEAQPIPEAEPVWDAAPAITAEAKEAPPPEPVPAPAVADAPKDEGLLEAMEFEDLPEAPAAVEAAKPETLPAEPSVTTAPPPEADQPARLDSTDAPEASVIVAPATQDAEADALEFSLAGDSPKPSAPPPEAESWQIAAAPKADAVTPAPPAEEPSPAPTEER
ncbi:hypothetical protein D7X32_19750, partial [Corallococcus carmarthensis]